MRYLTISEVFELHALIISSSGGSRGIRDLNALESAVNQPHQTFDQKDLENTLHIRVQSRGYTR
jgi:death-on-curing protein